MTCEGNHRGSSQEHRVASEHNRHSKSVLFSLGAPHPAPGRHVFEIITDSLVPFGFKGQSALPTEQDVHLQSQPQAPVKLELQLIRFVLLAVKRRAAKHPQRS